MNWTPLPRRLQYYNRDKMTKAIEDKIFNELDKRLKEDEERFLGIFPTTQGGLNKSLTGFKESIIGAKSLTIT